MYTIYVLRSLKDNNLYIGCTSDVAARLKIHNQGNVFSTKGRRPLKLIYSEKYEDKLEAFLKEKFYKTAKGKKELVVKLNNCGII